MRHRFIQKRVLLGSVLALIMLFVSAAGAGTFPKFESETLGGKAITDGIFADKQLTMVNIWATWCPPCVAEMPELAKLGSSMPNGTQLVGIVCDVSTDDGSALSEANRILNKAGAKFVQIKYDETMRAFLEEVDAIPTTIFVDSKGEIIGEPMVGSDSGENYRAAINQRLKQL